MAEYHKGGHSIYDIKYHFVWITKYITPFRELIIQSRFGVRQSGHEAEALNPAQICQLVYVADSAFFTEKNVKKAHGKKLSFISLISKNHKLRQICIEQVLQNKQMINLGRLSDQKNASEYHIQEISQDYHGIPLRCSVVYSTHLAEQKKATFARQLKKEQLQLEKDTEKLIEHNFVCSFRVCK